MVPPPHPPRPERSEGLPGGGGAPPAYKELRRSFLVSGADIGEHPEDMPVSEPAPGDTLVSWKVMACIFQGLAHVQDSDRAAGQATLQAPHSGLGSQDSGPQGPCDYPKAGQRQGWRVRWGWGKESHVWHLLWRLPVPLSQRQYWSSASCSVGGRGGQGGRSCPLGLPAHAIPDKSPFLLPSLPPQVPPNPNTTQKPCMRLFNRCSVMTAKGLLE